MGDSAYTGQTRVIEEHAPWAADLTQRRGRGYKYLSQTQRAINRKRSKVRYRGPAKNGNRLFVAAALANLYMVRRPLLDAARA